MGDLQGHPFRGNQYGSVAMVGDQPPGAPDMNHLAKENKIPAKITGIPRSPEIPEYQKKSSVKEVFDAASSIFDDLASTIEGL